MVRLGRWARAHVAEELLKRLAPLVAHLNAAGSVISELLVFGIAATLLQS
jgi:hypothetical protein